MYKPINGWTKERILDVIRARKFNEAAEEGGDCVYLTKIGNKCAVGLFIPDGHDAQYSPACASATMAKFQDLVTIMPFSGMGMNHLQCAHDAEGDHGDKPFRGNAKAAMLDWIEKNVKD